MLKVKFLRGRFLLLSFSASIKFIFGILTLKFSSIGPFVKFSELSFCQLTVLHVEKEAGSFVTS